jgi:hypothetical protein
MGTLTLHLLCQPNQAARGTPPEWTGRGAVDDHRNQALFAIWGRAKGIDPHACNVTGNAPLRPRWSNAGH